MKAEHRLPVFRVRLLALVAQADAGGVVRRSQIVRAIEPIGGVLALALLTDPPWDVAAEADPDPQLRSEKPQIAPRASGGSAAAACRKLAVEAKHVSSRKAAGNNGLGARP